MLDIEGLSKEEVYRIMLKHLVVMNLWCFMYDNLIRNTHPEVLESDEYMKIFEDYSAAQATELSKVLGITDQNIDSLVRLLRHSHWGIFEEIEVDKRDENTCSMRIYNCSTQRAAGKWGLEHYDCTDATLACLNSFCRCINGGATVKKVFAPPELPQPGTPETLSCEWLITLR